MAGGEARTDRGSTEQHDDVDRLRRERDALRHDLARLRSRPERRSRIRRIVAAICVVVSVTAFAAAVPGAWARRTIFNTDRYVALSSAIAAEPAVHDWLATRITDASFEALDVEGRLGAALSAGRAQLAFLAGPITQAVRDEVHTRVEAVLASDTFQRLWTEANRFVHAEIVAVLNGDSDVIGLEGDTVTLNTLPIVNEALKGLTGLASELAGRPVELPEIDATTIPAEGVQRIEDALNVDLPDDLGAIEVYDAAQLREVQRAVDLFDRGIVLLVLLFVVTLVAAVLISVRRRRTLLQACVAFALILVIERRFAIATASRIVDGLDPEGQAAGTAVMDVVLGDLLRYTAWLLTIALTLVVVALATGPYPWVRRVRRAVGDGVAVVAARRPTGGPVTRWVAARRDALLLAVAAVAIVILLLADLSLVGVAITIVALGLVALAVWRMAETLPPVASP